VLKILGDEVPYDICWEVAEVQMAGLFDRSAPEVRAL
jgi:hypothetical protein